MYASSHQPMRGDGVRSVLHSMSVNNGPRVGQNKERRLLALLLTSPPIPSDQDTDKSVNFVQAIPLKRGSSLQSW